MNSCAHMEKIDLSITEICDVLDMLEEAVEETIKEINDVTFESEFDNVLNKLEKYIDSISGKKIKKYQKSIDMSNLSKLSNEFILESLNETEDEKDDEIEDNTFSKNFLQESAQTDNHSLENFFIDTIPPSSDKSNIKYDLAFDSKSVANSSARPTGIIDFTI